MKRNQFFGMCCLAFGLLAPLCASAQEFGEGAMDRGSRIPFQGGEAIFKGICQGCHMPDGKGAAGAGAYPSLNTNSKLESAGYPVSIVLHGQKAMPAFGGMMTDKQVADVVTYIRANFGNRYKEAISEAEVKAAR